MQLGAFALKTKQKMDCEVMKIEQISFGFIFFCLWCLSGDRCVNFVMPGKSPPLATNTVYILASLVTRDMLNLCVLFHNHYIMPM